MIKYLAVGLWLALSSISAISQNSPQYLACMDKAKAQIEMNQCASQEAAHVDARLNKIYAQLLAKAGSDHNAVAKIKAAERAWIAYRDAYIDATYPAPDKQAEYGSIYPMDVALLQARLTGQHIADLQELLKQY